MNTRFVLFVLVGMMTAPAWGQPGSPGPPPSAVPAIPIDAADAPERFSAMDALEAAATGRAVIAAGWAWAEPADNEPLPEAARFSDALGEIVRRLGARRTWRIGDAAPDGPLAVFPLRGAWVLAPESREEVRTDFTGLTALDATPRDQLINQLLASLSEAQISRLGDEQGLPVNTLDPAQKALLNRALRPPLRLTRKEADADFPGQMVPKVVEPLDEAVNWTPASLRAHLMVSASVPLLGDTPGSVMVNGQSRDDSFSLDLTTADVMREFDAAGGAILPADADVPNTLKPSDLAGRAFGKPIGVSGQVTVADAVARLAKTTGLRLRADEPFRDMPVFLGSRALTSGQVMDGLCLALTAAWRKVGDTCILVWDRRGLGALRQAIAENAAAVTAEVQAEATAAHDAPAWRQLANSLPFDPDDPMRLTDEQRALLLTPDADGVPVEIPFAEMTPEQQAFLRRSVADDPTVFVDVPALAERGGERARPDGTPIVYPEEKMQAATLSANFGIALSVNVIDYGWVRLPDLGMLGQATADDVQPRPEPGPEAAPSAPPRPRVVAAALRGLMVPSLTPARLNALAPEMKRHGLNVLFYPALYGGYATFPNAAFPLDPALRDADGLAAAVTAMKPLGIKVVATVDVLAWQAAGQRVHWLNKHPDWLDVDIVGRTRLSWVEAHADALHRTALPVGVNNTEDGPDAWLPPRAFSLTDALLPSNYVRPAEPMVVNKLETLLRDLAKRTGIAGVAFDQWRPSGGTPGSGAPPLGYALPERIAALRAGGRDPIDVPTLGGPPAPRILGDSEADPFSDPDKDAPPDPYDVLVSRLLRRARAEQPRWSAWLVDPPVPPSPAQWMAEMSGRAVPATPRPPADILLAVNPTPYSFKSAALLRVWPAAFVPADAPGLAALRDVPPIAYLGRSVGSPGDSVKQALIFDFRPAPDELATSLKWIALPTK